MLEGNIGYTTVRQLYCWCPKFSLVKAL